MKYTVDRCEEDKVILESEYGEIIEVDKEELPDVHDGAIVRYEDGIYVVDESEEEKRRREILERFKKLRD